MVLCPSIKKISYATSASQFDYWIVQGPQQRGDDEWIAERHVVTMPAASATAIGRAAQDSFVGHRGGSPQGRGTMWRRFAPSTQSFASSSHTHFT